MADKKKKPQRLKARKPRGFVDRSPSDIRATEAMLAKIKEVYERYGFDPVETPMFEYTDALGKFLPDSDRPNEGVFSLQDDDDQWMSLRYDLTAPLARHVAENFNDINFPYRTYRAGYVFRNEKPGPGRFRQFMQFDADTIGAPGVQADAEMCMMMADTMEALGIARGDYVIRVNNRLVLDGILEVIGLDSSDDEERRLGVMRAIDKWDKYGKEGVRLLLGKGRKDESGDFTDGVGLTHEQIEYIVYEFSPDVKMKVGETFRENALLKEGYAQLEKIEDLVRSAGYGPDRIKIDSTVVRGLEYYTGPVYEAELLFDVTNEKGQKVQFGSVGGGGRYDGLVQRFMGNPVPGTGFSIGVSRLFTALKNLGKLQDTELVAPVIVCVMDRHTEALGKYQNFVQQLRDAGIRAEMYQGNPKQFGKQLQYADRRGSGIAIIQGSDEREKGEVQIKDLVEGRRMSEEITDNEEWRAARPAQFAVKEDEMVAAVQRLLKEQVEDTGNGNT